MFDKLDDLLIRFEELMQELNNPYVIEDQNRFRKLMKEQSDLTPIVETYKAYKEAKQTVEDSVLMLEEKNDEEMREMLKEELAQALSASQQVLCLDAPLSAQEEGTLSDVVADPKTIRQQERLEISEGLSALSSREQKLIALRYFQDYTQTETAKVLGVSQVQVSRLEKKALRQLREKMKET